MHSKKIIGIVTGLIFMVGLSGCQSSQGQYLKKAEEYMNQEEYGLALDNYNKAIMEDENLQEAYRGAGIANLKMADYKTAEDLFLRGLKESDGVVGSAEVDLSYYLGEVQLCLAKYKDALQCYSNIIEYDEDELEAYFYRGCVYLQLEEMEKAQKDFERAAKSGDSMLLYGIFEAYENKGSDAGRKYLEQIVKKKAETEEELSVQGRAYYKLGEEEKALETLKKSGEKDPQTLFYLASIYEQRGEYETAVGYYNSYKDKKGLTFGEYRTVADCMIKMGDYASAIELNNYMRKTAGKSEAKDLLFEEIIIYERSGDFANARVAAENYTKQYPEDEEGTREYEFLLTR